MEGVKLVGVYTMLAIAFYFLPAYVLRLSSLKLVHVDDFRRVPQILIFGIRQSLNPVLFRLFSKLGLRWDSGRVIDNGWFRLGLSARLSSLFCWIHIDWHRTSK